MSELRKALGLMKSRHQAARYPGDLADELLGRSMRPATPRASLWRWWIAIGFSSAAAMVSLALWHRKQAAEPSTPRVTVAIAQPATEQVHPTRVAARSNPSGWATAMNRLPAVPVDAVVSDVGSGMRDAMRRMGQDVDGALEAPVVVASVSTVRQVAVELGDFASVTWEQIRPRK